MQLVFKTLILCASLLAIVDSASTLTHEEKEEIFYHMTPNERAEILNVEDPSFEKVKDLICAQPDIDVQIARYKTMGPLGKGAFGLVKRVKDTCDNSEWAMKTFSPKLNAHEVGSFEYESEIMNILGNQDSIISFKRTLPRSKQVLMPLFSGSLDQTSFGVLNLYILKTIMKQIVDGVFAAHTLNIVVNDLKQENVLVESRSPPKVRLIDFGCAHDADKQGKQISAGTVIYMPWEKRTGMVKGSHKSGDIWAIGTMVKYLIIPPFEFVMRLRLFVTNYNLAFFPFKVGDDKAFEILDFFSSGFGEVPKFEEDLLIGKLSTMSRKIFRKKLQSIPKITELFPEPFRSDPHLASFLERCLQYDSKKRATIEELKFHPFLTS